MGTDANKALVLRFINEVQIGKDLSVVDKLFSPDLVNHLHSGDQHQAVGEFKDTLAGFFRAFPDLKVTVNEQIAEGDTVATLKTFSATHEVDFFGVPASGRQVEFRVMEFMKVKDGKITDHWGMIDRPTLMTQIGSPGLSLQ